MLPELAHMLNCTVEELIPKKEAVRPGDSRCSKPPDSLREENNGSRKSKQKDQTTGEEVV